MIKVGSDFSGVGAFDQALIRLGIDYKTVFACDMDKYARLTYIHNYGEPDYYPENVYDREIPSESLDIYMTSPPCQAFSIAGKRKGEDDKRGVLFYNSHQFIAKNNPRYFIFENVKGLLSDDGGKTFQVWLDMLGGKSVNGNPVMFARENATPYHIYWKVLNAKDYGVPQNRERVFIIGIRDDKDNNFSFPKPFHLTNRLKHILEDEVDEKYFLSDKAINHLINHKEKHDEKGTGFGVDIKDENSVASTLRANGALCPTDNHVKVAFKLSGSMWDKTHEQSRRVYDINGIGATLHTMSGGGQHPKIVVNQEPKLEFVGAVKEHNRGNGTKSRDYSKQNRIYDANGLSETITTQDWQMVNCLTQHKIRRLTPRECFRLMDFPDTFDFSVVSNSQAYKQAGNSIVVNVLVEIIKKIKL